MRILIHGINFHPEAAGVGKYTGEMAHWLAAAGHEVRVVTAPPHFPQWRVSTGFRAWKYDWQQLPSQAKKMEVCRCPIWVPKCPNGLKRLLHLASFALSSLPVMLWQTRWHPDLVLAIEPTFFCAPQALLAARWSGARAWLHVQDFEVDAAFELGDISSPHLRSWALAIEQWLLSAFDRVSTISGRMMDRLVQKRVDSPRCLLRLSHRPDLRFVFCGEGSYRQTLVEKAKDLPNVTLLPVQPSERLNDLLNLADIHLLPQRADAADLVMPSKLTGMLASGRPVLATADHGTQLARAVRGLGIVVPPGNLDAFVSAILDLAADKDLRLMLGREARRYALTHLDSLVILDQFEQSLLAVCGISGGCSKDEQAQGGANETLPRDLRTNFVEPPSTLGVINTRKPCV